MSLVFSNCSTKSKQSDSYNIDNEHNDMLSAASIVQGKRLASNCNACHSLLEGKASQVGPNLYGIVGAKAGRNTTFAYSENFKSKVKGKIWTIDRLYRWIRNPKAFLPGTKMSYGGMPDPQDRLDLIAYLISLKNKK